MQGAVGRIWVTAAGMVFLSEILKHGWRGSHEFLGGTWLHPSPYSSSRRCDGVGSCNTNYMAAPGQSSSMKIVLSYIRDRMCLVSSTFLPISSPVSQTCLQQFQDAHQEHARSIWQVYCCMQIFLESRSKWK